MNIISDKKIILLLQLALILAGIYSLRSYNYLLFHSFAELMGIVVAFSIFIIAWNSRTYFDNKIIFAYAMAMLPVAIISSLHTFSYKGVSIFESSGANLPTQLWILGRYLLSISLLLAPLLADKVKKKDNILYGTIAILTLILVLFFGFKLFPDAYIDGQGLTLFKVYSEYIIIGIFSLALYVLHKKREALDREVYRYVQLAIIFGIISEFLFTLYFTVTDIFNLLGHISTIISFFFLYAGIVEINLMQPYRLMFKDLKDLNIKKNEFLSLASHQLKNPLSTILLATEVINEEPTPTESAQHENYLGEIRESVSRMKQIIEKLLNVSKIEMGMTKTKEEEVSLKDLVSQNIKELEKIAEQKNVSFKVNLEENLYKIRTDKHLFGIVLENILSNAVRYSKPMGQVGVFVSSSPDYSIKITDNGYGIPKDQQHHIFKDYVRGENVAHVNEGTGLGLYMTKKIADKMGIEISFESQENQGTVFTLKIPKNQILTS